MPTSKDETFALKSAYIEMLHDEGIAVTWPGVEPVGQLDCINLNLLESAANQPYLTLFGADAYPTIYDKAACLFHGLIANHCFGNGNKRTAVLAIDQFLYANAHLLALSNDDMYDLAKDTASYRQKGIHPKAMMGTITKFVEENTVAFPQLRSSQPKFYKHCLKVRRLIRNDDMNSDDAIPKQARFQGTDL